MNQLARKRYEKKFSVFIKMITETKNNGVSRVVVSHPEVLGDNYEELVESLNRLSAAEITLFIVPPNQRS